jgi:Zn-dependent protease
LNFPKNKIRFEFKWGALVPLAAFLVITIIRFGLGAGIAATALLVACLAAHEAGHAVTAAATRTKVSALGFCLKGAYLRRSRAKGAVEILISLAGPAINLLLAVLLWSTHGIQAFLAQMNAFLFLINMWPHGGSDGQRILAEIRGMLRVEENAAA